MHFLHEAAKSGCSAHLPRPGGTDSESSRKGPLDGRGQQFAGNARFAQDRLADSLAARPNCRLQNWSIFSGLADRHAAE